MNRRPSRTRLGAAGIALAGVLFVLYEAVAPRADQTTLEGAASWASNGWAFAHIAAIVGLVLIPMTWSALRGHLDGAKAERSAFLAAAIGTVGSGLTISYYGAEVYGLKAIGEHAVAEGDASVTAVGESFRMDPTALTVFLVGLVLIAVAAVLAAIAVWRSGTMHRWSAVPMAAMMVLYLPQFFLPHSLRIAWGAAVTVSALWIAVELWRAAGRRGA
ncbi:hypothetical protein [Glycomyces tenuis]|uniref:hypothetical protein n=1 Tax=Glycomyces tenuis TaxID=58116 RepID=UPI0004178F3D|nr:hypothetical protein [Glycomyces tenuis]